MKNRQVILIVDDQTQNIELLEAYLTPQDYEIVTATSGEEALRKLAGNQIDLILLDIIMPGMDGFEVTRRVRQDDMHRLLPIIMVTVLQEAEDRIKGIEAGCDDFISKPIDKTELLARVRSLLKVKAYNDLLSSYRNELESEVIRRTDELKQALENLQQDITERRRVEEKLRESEKKYRLVVDNMADVIAVMDMNLRFTYVSPSIMRLRGYTVEEAMAQTLEQIMTPESLQITAKVFEEEIKLEASGTADPGRSRILELEEYRKDGSNVWIENHVSFIRDETQKPMGIISYSHDITDRKRAEEALRQNEEKYRTILEDIQESYFEVDFTGNFTFFNDSLCRLYGYSKEELMGMNYRHYTDKEQSKELFQTFNKVYNTGEPTERFGGQIIKKDGTKRYVEESVSLQKDSSGKPIGFRGIVRDITERRRAEEAVAENERKFSTLIGNLPGIVYRCDNDREWTMSFLSEGCRDLTGYAPEEIIGNRRLSYNDVINFEHRERIWAEVQTALSKREHYSFEYSITTAAGDVKWVWERGCGIFSPDGEVQALEGFISDITERRQAEQECQLSEERFRRIFDEGPFGMSLESPDHTIITANKVLCELLGYTEQELTGKSVADITCEEDRVKSKEVLGQLFANSIPVFRMEKRYVKKDGDILWANTTISAVHGQEGNVHYALAIIEDLTESRKSADKIHLLAYYDSLTGLPNRTFHKELMKRAIEHAQRHKEIFALIYIGLDNFQRINDSLGYSTGDLLLKAVADRLTNSLRKSDYVARSDKSEIVNVVSRAGGDEFMLLAHDLNQAQDAAKISHRLLEEMSAPYDLNGREVFITVSIGISLYPDDGTDVDELLKNAEKAMRHTKSEGKNNYHFYSSSMHSSVLALLTLESDLHKALERNELVLYYQPKVAAATGMIKGMEALIRWIHPDKGLIPPVQFIPMAETSGLIIPIGEFVIRAVCRQIKTWQEAGYKQIAVSLNVSGIQFDQQNLIEIVKDALRQTMIPSQCLELEITESVLMRNPEKAIRILTELEAMGIGILIDDFGTGYSSLSYLKRLPALDFLKIDQSFVKSLASDPKDQAIVRATIAMAHSLNLKTIAEGVETREQLSFLREHGCDEIQGYLFSRPLPAEDIPGILAKGYL